MKSLKFFACVSFAAHLNISAMENPELARRIEAVNRLAEITRTELNAKHELATEELAIIRQKMGRDLSKTEAEEALTGVYGAIYLMNQSVWSDISEGKLNPQEIAEQFTEDLATK